MTKEREHLRRARRAVIKVGSSVLTRKDGHLDPESFRRLAAEISPLLKRDMGVVLVSSGAIAAGVATLGLRERPRSIPEKQAAAAVGQSRLMHYYEEAFQKYGVSVGQILLTHDDLRSRKRYLNARHTMNALLKNGILPVVNENDSVAVDEIVVGDNDNLSALVAALVEADALVILSDIDGVYEEDPKKTQGARLVPVIADIRSKGVRSHTPAPGSLTTGGIITKIEAAEKASHFGIHTVIANGRSSGVLGGIFAGEEIGTLILPRDHRIEGRKHWIAFVTKPAGEIVVDEGAKKAIIERGKSLLPIGVKEVRGAFGPGDTVRILGEDRREFARGLVEFSSSQITEIKGLKTSQIESVLGAKTADEVIHRDDLVILSQQ